MDRPLLLCSAGDHPTVSFAIAELAKYLGLLTGRKILFKKMNRCEGFSALCVGTFHAFPSLTPPHVPDPALDDAIHIDTEGETGILAGIQERSVLLAVYRYLTELGCRWIRPGPKGQFLPEIASVPSVRVIETASYRHRAVCIEGAVSYEHVRDMIDWIPKLGFNGYFIQFREAHTFFDRWYAHEGHPELAGTSISKETALDYTARLEEEITKRSLLYHKVGHGWTCEPFGIHGLGWQREETRPDPEIVPYLAMVKGKRDFWKGVALNTQLCYSNPKARKTMVNNIVSYAKKYPEIHYLHVWLADGSNNQCECAACKDARPADFYVRLLQELDQALTEARLPHKIVFLIYVDLLWPPEKEKLCNTDRFVLMFAPIARTYSSSFTAADRLPALPAFHRNELVFPKDVDSNVALLKAWQEIFPGDSFDFDYHLMWDHANDPGHTQIARTIHEDIKGLKRIGLRGFVSCQVQRVFFPTGLAMVTMGRTLWDETLDFEEILEDHFRSSFGKDWESCKDYLVLLSDLFDPVYLRREKKGPAVEDEAARSYEEALALIDGFLPWIEEHLSMETEPHAQSWFYLKHHAELFRSLAEALRARALGKIPEARSLWEKTARLAWDKEPQIHPVFDTWLFADKLKGLFP